MRKNRYLITVHEMWTQFHAFCFPEAPKTVKLMLSECKTNSQSQVTYSSYKVLRKRSPMWETYKGILNKHFTLHGNYLYNIPQYLYHIIN